MMIGPRYITLLAVLLTMAPLTAAAQQIEQSSWTIQDRRHDLEHPRARVIIEKANDWRTREDPFAATARLDDPLRVTIITDYDAPGGVAEARLARLTMGTVVVDSSFSEFLDSNTIAWLIRREYFWRDENVQSLTGSGTIDPEEEDWRNEYAMETAFAPDDTPRAQLSLDESTYRLGRELHLWGGIGFEELALPDFSYGKIRLGVRYQQVRIWGEAPLEVGSSASPILARGLGGAFGFGMSVDAKFFGGAISWSDPGSPTLDPLVPAPVDTTYALGRAAFLHGTVRIGDLPAIGGYLRAKIGAGYIQTVITSPVLPENQTRGGEEVERAGVLLRLEYSNRTTGPGREVALELFGASVLASYREEFTTLLGVRFVVAKHGMFGARDPWLPSWSVSISPTLTFR